MRLYVPTQGGRVRFKTQRNIHDHTFLENGAEPKPCPELITITT
jgi:hypothetical protein